MIQRNNPIKPKDIQTTMKIYLHSNMRFVDKIKKRFSIYDIVGSRGGNSDHDTITRHELDTKKCGLGLTK